MEILFWIAIICPVIAFVLGLIIIVFKIVDFVESRKKNDDAVQEE